MYVSQLVLAIVATAVSSTEAFTFNPIARNGLPLYQSRIDQGWNNDNFLDALSNGSSAIDDANAQYQRESQSRSAMRERRLQSMAGQGGEGDALFGGNVQGMPDSVPPITKPNDEDNPMGGERFRQMMEMAKKSPMERSPRYLENTAPAQAQAVPPPPSQMPNVPVAPAPNAQPASMDAQAIYQMQLQTWQQQMTFYSQMVAADPEAAAKMTMPPPPQPPNALPATPVAQAPPQQGFQPAPPQQAFQPQQPAPQPSLQNANPADFVPKPVNEGNRDAYEITNPADVYFAQLKRDSTVRIQARKAGDLVTANNAFGDESVKALGSFLSPELIQQRREQLARNGGEFETSRDEMIIPLEEEEEVDRTYTGVSYRQKLQEKLNKRKQT